MSLISVVQSDALLKEIEQQTRDETRAIVETAEREARAIVAEARATARRHMHGAVEELRREGARRLSHVKAQIETEQRRRDQQRAAEAIRQAWPLLIEALAARWRDPAGRQAWITSVAHQARDRLRHGAWTVQHPAAWSADEQRSFCEALGPGRNTKVSFAADDDVTAGLRIRAEQATLDATPRGLLVDEPGVAAMFLAELDRRAA